MSYSNKQILKLGTRRSLLAWAQSSWVAREIEKLNPGTKVELVGIETRGDKIQDVPLQKVEGKDFFVAELDRALVSGEVDFCVHSMKDLSLERPAEVMLACVPKRENPRDIVIFHESTMKKIANGETLKIGTSSPRRLQNIPSFLESALPKLNGKSAKLSFVEIRGNVNTRLSRIHEADGSERRLDAVVLAFAGLIRLGHDEKASIELSQLMKNTKVMILPIGENPTAPAQGALAVECRKNAPNVIAALKKLHDQATEDDSAAERKILAEYGGGCHQRFGATVIRSQGIGPVLHIKGVRSLKNSEGEATVDEVRWNMPKPTNANPVIWDGVEERKKDPAVKESDSVESLSFGGNTLFIAHSRAMTPKVSPKAANARMLTSGTPSWFRLAEMGFWIEACAEDYGFEAIKPLLAEKFLNYGSHVDVLTHAGAEKGWSQAQSGSLKISVHSTYETAESDYSEESLKKIQQATHVYFSSPSQYRNLKSRLKPNTVVACGVGKTANAIEADGAIAPLKFPNSKEWRKWLQTR